jgi:AmmeMemoRadiSam system protein A
MTGAEVAVPAESPAAAPEPTPEDPFTPLTEDERRTLLKVAWQILSAHLRERPIEDSDLPASEFTPRLLRPRGCFVALKKNGQLRGMQGEIEASRPLLRQVAVFARKAATRDPRFEPLTDLDLPALVVEISVIGPRRTIAGPADLRPDLDGIFLEKWGRRALFLPGIGAAQGWTAEHSLDELCRQATLPPGAWATSAKLQTFTTEVIAGGEPPAPVTPTAIP